MEVTKSIYKEKGLKGFTCGLSATFAREMPGYFFFFGGYEACRTLLTPVDGRKEDLGPIKTVIAGGAGGVSLWVAIFPFDVVKSRMQIGHHTAASTAHLNQVSKQSMLSVLLDIKKNEGVSALYRGLGPTVLRTFPATGALFLAVEWTLRYLLTFMPVPPVSLLCISDKKNCVKPESILIVVGVYKRLQM
ncbi:unnamed protein product [Heterobilharzia americana]|nr:unnamed protein product [Heterobilharzia americana]